MRIFKEKKTSNNVPNSLFGLFIKEGWERDLLNTAREKIYRATKCPCEAEEKCLHDILPDEQRIGGEFCGKVVLPLNIGTHLGKLLGMQ